MYVVTVLPLPHTMPVLNAMQLQRDDLAPWGGWKHTCNLWWWQATIISIALMHYAYKLIQRDKIDAQRERESRTGSVRRSQNWLYSFSKYTPFRSWLWHYSFATIYVRLTLKRKNVTVYTNQEQIMTFSSNFELALLLISMHDLFYLPLFLKRIKSKQN